MQIALAHVVLNNPIRKNANPKSGLDHISNRFQIFGFQYANGSSSFPGVKPIERLAKRGKSFRQNTGFLAELVNRNAP